LWAQVVHAVAQPLPDIGQLVGADRGVQFHIGEGQARAQCGFDTFDFRQPQDAFFGGAGHQLFHAVGVGAGHIAEHGRGTDGDGRLFGGREVQHQPQTGQHDGQYRQEGEAGARQRGGSQVAHGCPPLVCVLARQQGAQRNADAGSATAAQQHLPGIPRLRLRWCADEYLALAAGAQRGGNS